MDSQVISSLISAAVSVLVAVFAWQANRANKKIAKLETFNDSLKGEIRIRQSEEDIACEWLVSSGAAKSILSAKRELRKRTRKVHGSSPKMSPKSVS